MRKIAGMAVGMFLLSMAPFIPAQSVPPPAPETPLRAPAELDQLLGPIALYPDPLIAEILPASTLPSEIVMAERYMNDGGDTNQIASQGWDPSVQALAHYPAVLKWMDDNLAWTTQLGQAFETQQGDVMDAIQRLRGEAQNLGNLPNTPQETVDNDNGDIEIEPANPDEMYVPDYPPDMIYYQPGVYCTYGIGLPIGLWLGYDWDWRSRRLLSWGPGHPRPGGWWHQSPRQRHDYISAHSAPAWHNGRGGAVAANRWDRGFAQPEVYRSFAQPVVPRTAAPRVTTGRPAENFHSSPALSVPAARGLAPVEHRAFAPSETTGGVFGGFQSGRDAQASSFRGQASRAAIAPSFSESRGGGGGGGGGGERKGR